MRLIEACGSGTCLLTDDKPNIREYFVPGEEVVVFNSAEEAVEKIRYLEEHEDFRKRVAAAGQRKVLDRFSFFHRAQRLDEYLHKII
jgi:spore maturation protein CgeB